MRIALLYPPPWKIAEPDDAGAGFGPEGPPEDFRAGDLDADFFQTPYGLLSLGAQAMRAGHQVKVWNLSGFSWRRVEQVIAALDADLFGLSCWTANRRGVGYAARAIRKLHPEACIVVGGPHATPLAKELLAHHPEIDLVSLGESEEQFLELAARLQAGKSCQGIAGTIYRDGSQLVKAPPRAAIHDLDALASVHDYFDTHIVMTSRGCPWACTFCGAEASWGRGFRALSVPVVLDALEQAVSRASVKMLQIKDDTFTTNKKRVLALCRGIRERKLNFFWSCDTRVDVLSDELLKEMRLSGCRRLSLGVESGSQRILDGIDKKITVDEIVESTEIAKKYGIQVRYYMMLGNRGETRETFQETLAFLKRAEPHQYVFSCLSIFPGTRDFQDAERAGWLDREIYFTGDFQELKTPYDADDEVTAMLREWFEDNRGLRQAYAEDTEAARAVLSRLGDYHSAHMDLAAALFREGRLDDAEQHALRALELGYPAPGLAYNLLAVVALRRGQIQTMQDHFMTAAKTDPQHHVLVENVEATRAWFRLGGPENRLPLELAAHHDFQLMERTVQPTLPGPLPPDFADFDVPQAPVRPSRALDRTNVTLEGHDTGAFPERRLRVLS